MSALSAAELALMLVMLYLILTLLSGLRKKRVRYIDDGSKGSFRSDLFRITAKPDLIEDGTTIVEKKSRRSGVYESDKKQLIATALAVRSKHKIRSGYIVTQTERVAVDLTGSDRKLFSLIKTEHAHAWMVNEGRRPPPSPTRSKCRSCQFNKRCEYAYAG